jgi:anion-transporting  ArsA/GET3 family ATPase
MPDIALDWVRALMRLLVKYGTAGSLDALARDLLAFAKRLKQLKLDLSTHGTTAVFVVTLDEPMVNAETARLSAALETAGVPVAAKILNRAGDDDDERSMTSQIRAPDFRREVVGPAALRSFLAQWEIHGG